MCWYRQVTAHIPCFSPAGDKARSGCGYAAVYSTVMASRAYQGANVHRCKKGARKKRCLSIPPAGYRGHGWAPTASQRIAPGSLSTTYIITSGNYTLPNLHVPVANKQPNNQTTKAEPPDWQHELVRIACTVVVMARSGKELK